MITTSLGLSPSKEIEPLIQDIGAASLVMLGEASHGTHEYYTWRAAITKRLVEEKNFSFIAVEGDWPDCYRINRYVKGYPDAGEDIHEILKSFNRWPTWMWANWEIASLAEWLRDFNESLPMEKRVGFYGLDVYSLWESMNAMMTYLEKEDPDAAVTVRKALKCFESYEEEGQLYAEGTAVLSQDCREQVVDLLKEIRLKAQHYDGDREAGLNTEQNARVTVNAEKYYRNMLDFNADSWNIRDRHMMDTLIHLLEFHGAGAKGIIWEHNTHIGDARATDMSKVNMINIGQLAREQYGKENVYLIGFGSYSGSVIAGSSWGAPMKEMEVPPAIKGSVEELLHSHNAGNRLLIFDPEEKDEVLNKKILHRAIGVVYNPEHEGRSNYIPSVMSERYNAFIFIDESSALHPLHIKPDGLEVPETYPFGI